MAARVTARYAAAVIAVATTAWELPATTGSPPARARAAAVPVTAQPVALQDGPGLEFWRLPEDAGVAARLLEAEVRRDPLAARALVRDADTGVRARAILALGRIGLPDSLPLLQEAARDPQPLVRAAAAFALGLLQYDLDFQLVEVVRQRAAETLQPMMSDPDRDVAARAAAAIGAVGVGSAGLRVWLAGASQQPAEVVAAAVSSWWRLEPTDAAPLAHLVGAADPSVRLQVAHALRRSRDVDRAPLLARLLQDEEVEVRIMALRGLHFAPARLAYQHVSPFLQMGDWREQCEALAWLGAAWRLEEGVEVDEDVYVQVVRRTLDRNPHTRACALRAHGALPDRAVSVDLLLEATGDAEPAVQAAALGTLAAMPPAVQRAAVRRLTSDPPATAEIAVAVLRLRSRAGLMDATALAEAGRTADPSLAAAALEELERVDPRAAWQAARALLDDDSAERVSAGAAAIARLAPFAPDETERAAAADELWRAFADRRELAVRTVAFQSMERLAGEMLARRSVLLEDLVEPALRRQAARFLASHTPVDERDREAAALLLAPGAVAVDALPLAERALQLQESPPLLQLTTARGTSLVRLRADLAPLTAMRFLDLVDAGALEGVPFYRVIPAFVAQGGPGPLLPWAADGVPNEETPAPVIGGVVGLALAGQDTGTNEFWIATAAQPHLQGGYPVFAEVVEGQRAVARIQAGDAMHWSRVQEQP